MKQNVTQTNNSFSKVFVVRLILILTFSYSSFTSYSQSILTTENYTATQLVENILFNSSCATVTNVTVSGGNFVDGQKTWGYFNANSSYFPFQDGIILSTGKIANAVGPNTFISDDGNGIGWGTDSDLNDALSISNSLNATVLEFDFTPYGDKISFDYIFASEEYHGTATCNYSDGFAFLLKPVGGANYQNLALIPNSNTPVKVTTVHPEIPGGCSAQNEEYFGSFNGTNHPTNYNGQTAVLTARADVIPGTPYHIKLVIADEGNYRYDSAIFLKGSSFNFGVDLGEDRLFANQNPVCPNETILLDATSSATNYQWNFNGVPILGANNSTLTLNPPYTNAQNGTYSVDVTYNPTCVITSEIQLEFASDFTVNQQTYSFCDDNEDGITTISLNNILPTLFNNLPANYSVSFYNSPSSTTPLPLSFQNTTPFSQTIYAKITTINCFAAIPITLNVLTFGVTISDEFLILCKDDTTILNADAGYSSYVWNTGETSNSILINSAGNFSVQITNAAGCSRVKNFTVNASEIAVIEAIITNGLNETNSAEITVSGNGNYLYSLDGIHYQESNVFYNLNIGENNVFVYDENLCGIAYATFTMTGIPKFFTPNDDGINDYWNIKGLKIGSNSKTIISIFDRYGKLIKQISAVGKGWDGKINGTTALSDDYWFFVTLEGGNLVKGHFTLKR